MPFSVPRPLTHATRWAALALLVAAPALAGGKSTPRPSEARSRSSVTRADDFDWSGAIAAGKHLEIKGVNGSIEAEPGGGSKVQVHAVKHSRRSDPDLVKIEVIEHEDGVTLCVLYPTPPGSPPNDCVPGEDGHMSTRNNDVNVDFTVRLPDGVGLVARTVNGEVRALGLSGDVEAHTVNGSVDIATSERARASSVNGSVRASLGRTDDSGPLEFETVNGRIVVELPDGAGADVKAETVNGSINTDFPLTVRGRFNARHVSGTIGKGGPALSLRTVNGDIRLRAVAKRDS